RPDASGKQTALADFSDAKLVVLVFLGTECPIGNAYVPDLVDFRKRYLDKHVQVIGVNSNLSDSAEAIAKHAKEFRIDFPLLVDNEQLAADLAGARRTPEVFVLDQRRAIRYHGRIDDRLGYDFKKDKPLRPDLEEAIKELLADKPVSVSHTELEGCLITRRARLKDEGEITYAKHVAAILQNRCANCHHPGAAAPFSLLTYESARDWSEMIREVVSQRRMPPWNVDPRYGHFSNDLRMTKQEIDVVTAWIDGGSPLGDKKDLPKLREFAENWMIGKPDLILKMPREFTVQATGTVKYQYFVTPTNFKQDRWVQASEARPGNRAVVHHIIAFVRPKGSRRFRGLPAVGGSAPGEEPNIHPEGVGFRIPAGAEIVWQVHYTPTGKVEKDRSEVGLVFCKKPPRRQIKGGGAFNVRFQIPPGASNHRLVSHARFTKDVELLTLMPHMHLRGKDFRYTAHFPDGRKQILLNIPDYDFNWQHRYRFAKPIFLPKGTSIECVAHFDNSANNPANPDPTKTVRWGDQTWEEMMIGWYSHVDALKDEPPTPKPATSESSEKETTAKQETTKPETAAKQETAKQETTKQETTSSKESAAPSGSVKSKTETGSILKRVYDFKEAGKEMEYALYLPKDHDASKSYPLIVALHGLYSNPRQILGYPGFTKRAEKHGYVLVAPMGYNNRGWYGSRGKGGGRGSDPKNLGELSEKDVMNVLKLVREEFKIDEERVYLLGHSMGGGGSLHLAMTYPKLWAAIAPIAPAARGISRLERAKHIPAIIVQGDQDRLVPVRGVRQWVEKMKELGMKHQYIEVKGGGHVLVAFQHFDEIFEFFNKHPRTKQEPADSANSTR
ncbi:MAG: redoxin domain-containing protein, partial [Planctomycetales bacterium]